MKLFYQNFNINLRESFHSLRVEMREYDFISFMFINSRKNLLVTGVFLRRFLKQYHFLEGERFSEVEFPINAQIFRHRYSIIFLSDSFETRKLYFTVYGQYFKYSSIVYRYFFLVHYVTVR